MQEQDVARQLFLWNVVQISRVAFQAHSSVIVE
jgi:hypothetical protein